MKRLASLLIFACAATIIDAGLESSMTLNHPDKNGYQSVVAGSDKHKYGYELKENKHFHHTTTEKDGVRLGCYGYELDGKKYSTQYVADSRGYRIVSTQDLITVYPKAGGKSRKASFFNEFNEDPSQSGNIQYFFPTGCKRTDILIDNSSRLRSIAHPDVVPRLPVTLKTTPADAYTYSTPPNTYIPPGPPHIYAPNQIPGSNRPNTPTKEPTNVYLPAQEPSNVYLPAPEPSNVYLPAKEPAITSKPPNVYLPPDVPPNAYLPPKDPTDTYLPPKEPTNTYLPPGDPANTYLPPANKPTKPRPTISHEIVPPKVPEGNCGQSSCCDESTAGKFVIPIPMRSADGCCKQTAKLILPLKGFDPDSIKKLRESINEEFDATELIRSVLQNIL